MKLSISEAQEQYNAGKITIHLDDKKDLPKLKEITGRNDYEGLFNYYWIWLNTHACDNTPPANIEIVKLSDIGEGVNKCAEGIMLCNRITALSNNRCVNCGAKAGHPCEYIPPTPPSPEQSITDAGERETLKIFKHEGNGHYVGSCVIVTARNIETAKQIIRNQLDNSGLSSEEINIVESEIMENNIIHSVNGDY